MHSQAVNRANGARLDVRHAASNTTYTIDVRVSDDSAAVRYVVPGQGPRVPDAAMGFNVPAGTVVWSHGLGDHYEAVYEKRRVEDVPEGDWAAPPVTFKLPGDTGYAAIAEADLRNYAGMALQSDGRGGYLERLGHAHPPNYPFKLRFGDDNIKRLSVAASVDGPIVTPWRVVIVGRDLNTLVNSDAIHNLCPPPDKTLFPRGMQTPWLRPGRAVWRYLDGGESSIAGIKEFSRLAGELGFEHQIIEGQWQKWSAAELRDVVEYSKARGVDIWVWRHRNTLGDAAKRRDLFAMLQQAGVKGVKVDFLDHEAKEVIDLYQAILRDAAAHQLMINFHGANKPAGEPRTWPNEMTREAIYGLEHKRMEAWGAFNATFPFVRMLAGHADYTPLVLGERRRETSWAHQIASAVILTSPVLVYGGNPASLLSNPAVEMIKIDPERVGRDARAPVVRDRRARAVRAAQRQPLVHRRDERAHGANVDDRSRLPAERFVSGADRAGQDGGLGRSRDRNADRLGFDGDSGPRFRRCGPPAYSLTSRWRALARRLRVLTIPASPNPARAMVPGSGTGAASAN